MSEDESWRNIFRNKVVFILREVISKIILKIMIKRYLLKDVSVKFLLELDES